MIPQIEWDKLIKNGIFAALFIMLLVYVMNANNAREQRYNETIDKLSDTINTKLVELKAMHSSRS